MEDPPLMNNGQDPESAAYAPSFTEKSDSDELQSVQYNPSPTTTTGTNPFSLGHASRSEFQIVGEASEGAIFLKDGLEEQKQLLRVELELVPVTHVPSLGDSLLENNPRLIYSTISRSVGELPADSASSPNRKCIFVILMALPL